MRNYWHRNVTFLRRFVLFGSCLATLTLLPGCGGSGSGDGGQQNPTPGLIGVAGGSLTSADGKVTLVVPPNAVSGDTQFTIDPANGFPPSSRIVGTVYDIEPTGTSFPAGALPQLTIAYGTLPAGVDPATVTIGTLENGLWVDVPGSAGNQAAQTMTASLAHLSPYAVLQPGEDPTPSNQNPIASTGGPLYLGQVNRAVTFSAVGSVDPDNDPLTYTWHFGDSSPSVSVTALTTTHTYTSQGDFTVILTVSDGRGGSDAEQTTARISDLPPPNTPPIADAGGPYVATVGQEISFSAADSFDPDGDPLTYVWDFGDGGSAIGMTPLHAYTSEQTWPVTVTVSDSFDESEDSTTATISPVPSTNHPPVLTDPPTIPTAGLTNQVLLFDAVATDVDGDALTYSWTFGDGSPNTAPSSAGSATHQYPNEGSFQVTLTVSDGRGGTASSSAMISITIPQSPVAFSQQLTVFKRQTTTTGIGGYLPQYAITLGGSGVPPLTFKIVTFPAHHDLPSMDLILGQRYQWQDPTASSTLFWRPECFTHTPPQSCLATTSSHVDLTAGPTYGDVTMTPADSPVTVVYEPQNCVVWIGLFIDSFSFTVTDATGASSPPATVNITVDNKSTCKLPTH